MGTLLALVAWQPKPMAGLALSCLRFCQALVALPEAVQARLIKCCVPNRAQLSMPDLLRFVATKCLQMYTGSHMNQCLRACAITPSYPGCIRGGRLPARASVHSRQRPQALKQLTDSQAAFEMSHSWLIQLGMFKCKNGIAGMLDFVCAWAAFCATLFAADHAAVSVAAPADAVAVAAAEAKQLCFD